ncbi:hypothetical protein D3C80_665900 [compost metagenome]
MHPRAILVGDFTYFLQWINCACIGRTRSCNHTCHDFTRRLKISHGFFQGIHIHLCICIYRNSHNRLEAHTHHCHVLLHRKMCIFRTNYFDVTHRIRRDTITLNRPGLAIFVFPVFRNTRITCQQYTHQVRLCTTRGKYTCLTCTITNFLTKPINQLNFHQRTRWALIP